MKEETLLFREKMKPKNNYRNYHRPIGVYHDVDNISIWKRIQRILKKHIGKSFDDAFSEFCKQVPQYQQFIFLGYFNNRFYIKYYLDDNNLIQLKKKKKKEYKIYSDDYKLFWKHKITKLITYNRPYNSDMYEQDYEGTITIVYSKKDKRWKEYVAKEKRKNTQYWKAVKQRKKETADNIFKSALEKQKENKLKQIELDIFKKKSSRF